METAGGRGVGGVFADWVGGWWGMGWNFSPNRFLSPKYLFKFMMELELFSAVNM